jgi:phage terminase large subunit
LDIEIPAGGWRPREYQQLVWKYLENGGRRAVAVWHRRAGKDEFCMRWASVAAFEAVGNYWHMLPEAAQARKAIWDAVNPHTGRKRIDEAFPMELRRTTRQQEMMIEFVNGSTWQLVGSDNFNSLVGSTPRGVVFSEWAIANPSAWAFVRPILLENGGWALFNYTPRGNNHGRTIYDAAVDDPKWFAEILPADKTGVFQDEQLKDEEQEYIREYGRELGRALFRQEYFCSFDAAVLGAYYALEMSEADAQGRIAGVPYEKGHLVHTAWDLGVSDHTSIWFFQSVGREIRLIDFYTSSGVGLDHYVGELQGKGYRYGNHLLPHDVNVTELGTGRTRVETLRSLGLDGIKVVPQQRVAEGINAARSILSRCWFDRAKCSHGISALREYKSEWDQKLKTLKPHPKHDWASHPADAFRYLAMGLDMVESQSAAFKTLDYQVPEEVFV